MKIFNASLLRQNLVNFSDNPISTKALQITLHSMHIAKSLSHFLWNSPYVIGVPIGSTFSEETSSAVRRVSLPAEMLISPMDWITFSSPSAVRTDSIPADGLFSNSPS
jgi:hypothetical protein